MRLAARFTSCMIALVLCLISCFAAANPAAVRERILLDTPWRFSLGHATDRAKDFNHATGYFSYLAKTGFGDGPASPVFDDRVWRTVSIPHDWAVEMPFDPAASPSHGYKAVGPGFPQNSVGWYRHHFDVPESDLGRRISLEFDGIQRAARVFVNGFFMGEENLGNIGQQYDITAYLNYGGDNVIAVRADVSIEAGWYFEGAGINRDVWLVKTNPVHIAQHGTFVTSDIGEKHAMVKVETTVLNRHENSAAVNLAAMKVKRSQTIIDAAGKSVVEIKGEAERLPTGGSIDLEDHLRVNEPRLWSTENPYLYTLITRLEDDSGTVLDEYRTRFGIRSIHFDPDAGFFLNGKHLKLKGSNNHEDHAGVGTATPRGLIEYRLQRLKSMGMNAYRASHAPASPALLDIADRMGMLVIDETRLSGINDYHLEAVEKMIRRGRNHPSIILWSLGNEEWAIEGNIKGARIAKTMQSFARRLDPTRLNTIAISGGWGGISTEIGVMGVNYIKHGDTDKQHRDFPWQIIVGTEETTTQQTRGIYVEDKALGHLPPQEDGSSGGNVESGWQYYEARDYLAGIFYWTGFDYRGEPTPYEYPAVASQFGILDSCGFPKDSYYYLKSWWTEEPVLHIFPHWNWPGREGQPIEVRAHSNADEVELWLNGKSFGRQVMPRNGHIAWKVPYTPGELRAVAWRGGKVAEQTRVATTTAPARLVLEAPRTHLNADGHDVAVISVSVKDKSGRVVPDAQNPVRLQISGPGKIIGVGNGNPSSLEADVQTESVRSLALGEWKAPDPADNQAPVTFVHRFDRPKLEAGEQVKLLLNALGHQQTVWLNGTTIYESADLEHARTEVALQFGSLKAKNNEIRMAAQAHPDWGFRERLRDLIPASLAIVRPAPHYERKLFNGWAQVTVQSEDEAGVIRLGVTSEGVQSGEIEIHSSD